MYCFWRAKSEHCLSAWTSGSGEGGWLVLANWGDVDDDDDGVTFRPLGTNWWMGWFAFGGINFKIDIFSHINQHLSHNVLCVWVDLWASTNLYRFFFKIWIKLWCWGQNIFVKVTFYSSSHVAYWKFFRLESGRPGFKSRLWPTQLLPVSLAQSQTPRLTVTPVDGTQNVLEINTNNLAWKL